MKKTIKYLLYLLFAVCGASSVYINSEWSLFWILGVINVTYFGGYLIIKLFNYLED